MWSERERNATTCRSHRQAREVTWPMKAFNSVIHRGLALDRVIHEPRQFVRVVEVDAVDHIVHSTHNVLGDALQARA